MIVAQEPGSGLRVVFERPTLTDRDVIWIAGFKPTEIVGTGEVRKLSYEALPVHRPRDDATSLVIRLSFNHVQGDYRLSEVEVPEKFNSILPPPLLDAAVKVVCKTRIVAVPPSTTFDLTDVDRATLPTQDALRQVLGPPTTAIPRTNEISYQYCLAPCDAQSSMVANLTFTFGIHGELQRAQANYFRYSAVVDLVSSRPTATIELH